VIIRGGFPGHAVIVMNMAVTTEGKKIYLLAQSYMPAQDIHVLINPNNNDICLWYEVSDVCFYQRGIKEMVSINKLITTHSI
jgi:hypothetical protein